MLSTKKIEDARLYLNKVLSLNPNDYEAIKDLGNSYQAVGDFSTAKNYYQKAISINAFYAPALTMLGSIELNSKNKEDALSLLIITKCLFYLYEKKTLYFSKFLRWKNFIN